MTVRRLAQVAAIAGLFVGCGGGGGGTPLTETEFCKQKAEAECVVTDRCVTTKTDCQADRMAACMQFVGAAKANQKRLFVAGNVGNCVNKARSVYSKTAPITPTELADLDDVCNYVFQGKGKVNVDMCETKYDCADRVICDKSFCATQKSVTTTCGNPGDICGTGNYCAQNSSQVFVCMPKGDAGDMCDAAKPCMEALRCAGGTCMDRIASAGSCSIQRRLRHLGALLRSGRGLQVRHGLDVRDQLAVVRGFRRQRQRPGNGRQRRRCRW